MNLSNTFILIMSLLFPLLAQAQIAELELESTEDSILFVIEEKPLTDDQKAELQNLRNQAVDLMNIGEYDVAAESLDKAIEIAPWMPEIYAERGRVYSRMRNFSEAEENFRQSQTLDASNAEYYYLTASMLQKQRFISEASEQYTAAISISSTPDKNYHFNRGNCYLMMEQYEDAIRDFSLTLEIDPQHYSAMNNRAYAHYSKEDLDAACADWKKAAENGQDNAAMNASIHCGE